MTDDATDLNAVRIPDLAEHQAALVKRQVPLLGALCCWSAQTVEIDVTDLETRLQALGFDPRVVPIPEARGAVTRALESLKLQYRTQRHKLDGGFALSLNSAHVHQNGGPTVEVQLTVEQVIQFDSTTKVLSFKTPEGEAEIRARYAKYLRTLTSDDIRTVIQRVLRTVASVSWRAKGGVEFVPRQHLEVVERLKQLCDGIPGLEFRRVRIPDLAEDRQDVLKSALPEILAELTETETEIAEMAKRESDGKTVRSDALQARVDRVKGIRMKAAAYKDLLEIKAEQYAEIEARVGGLSNSLLSLL